MAEANRPDAHFLLRRLHSLTGIVPIGLFLCVHLVTNSSIVWGAANGRAGEYADTGVGRAVATFQKEVDWINGLPFLLLIEISLWLSIAFHSLYGLYIAATGRSNLGAYGYQANWRYSLQRWSGYIGIFFIFYHVATLRWGWSWLVPGGVKWSHHAASSTLAEALRGGPDGVNAWGLAVSLFYMLGVTMLVFHFANGLWTTAITWGLTVTRAAQRRWGYACAALGVLLMALGWASVIGFALLDVDRAREVEQRMHSGEVVEGPPNTAPPTASTAAADANTLLEGGLR